jgi:hypothetical protein
MSTPPLLRAHWKICGRRRWGGVGVGWRGFCGGSRGTFLPFWGGFTELWCVPAAVAEFPCACGRPFWHRDRPTRNPAPSAAARALLPSSRPNPRSRPHLAVLRGPPSLLAPSPPQSAPGSAARPSPLPAQTHAHARTSPCCEGFSTMWTRPLWRVLARPAGEPAGGSLAPAGGGAPRGWAVSAPIGGRVSPQPAHHSSKPAGHTPHSPSTTVPSPPTTS